MAHIKNKTYHNFMIICHQIMRKGYTNAEAQAITHQIFDNYNPLGLSIQQMADRIITKEEHITMYR